MLGGVFGRIGALGFEELLYVEVEGLRRGRYVEL